MKEQEGFVDYPDQQMILYVEKDSGEYGPLQTGSYLSAHYMDDYNLKRRNLERELRGQLEAGLISPVRYYMVLEELTISELASRASIRKSRVRKHMDHAGFGSATVEELERYAQVFNVPPANLLQIVLIRQGEEWESNLILENRGESVSVTQHSVKNPHIVMTRVEKREKPQSET